MDKLVPVIAEYVDYLFTYNNNNTIGCAVAFDSLSGGKTCKIRKRKSATRKRIKNKDTTPFVFTLSSFGMPIMYTSEP